MSTFSNYLLFSKLYQIHFYISKFSQYKLYVIPSASIFVSPQKTEFCDFLGLKIVIGPAKPLHVDPESYPIIPKNAVVTIPVYRATKKTKETVERAAGGLSVGSGTVRLAVTAGFWWHNLLPGGDQLTD